MQLNNPDYNVHNQGLSQYPEGSRILDTNLSVEGSTTMDGEKSRNKLLSPQIHAHTVNFLI